MVDTPETLRTICLKTFVQLLRTDQQIWRNILQENLDQTSPIDQQKRKQHRGESFSQFSSPIIVSQRKDRSFFLDYFLRGFCPLNLLLSDRLLATLFRYDQLNDFTIRLFSGRVTCLKRLIIPIKSITRLSFDLFEEHPNLTDLEIIFKDSSSICPSNRSNFNDIIDVYGPHATRRRASRAASICHEEIPPMSDEFSDQKLLTGIFTHLHPLTIERLKSLSLTNFKFFNGTSTSSTRKYSMVDMSPLTKCVSTTTINAMPTNLRLILKFTNLTSLNLSSTDIKNPCLDVLLDTLTNLETLDLSSCQSITSFHSLLKLCSKLKSLNLAQCPIELQTNPSIYHIFYQLEFLEYLDISQNPSVSIRIDPNSEINLFLRQMFCLPRLKYIDLSGHSNISSNSLQMFIHYHRQLQFLGLFLTQEKYLACLTDSTDPTYSKTRRYALDIEHLINKTITEEHLQLYQPFLIEGLNRYDQRPIYVQKILYYIFFLSRLHPAKQLNSLLDSILHVMAIHSHNQPVQMASTACIFNLTRAPMNEQIHLRRLARIVKAIKQVMAFFPEHQQMQKNCLLTLCSDRILHEPIFDFYRLATLVMKTLQNYTDLAIIQPAVAILSLLTTRLTIDECGQLGSIGNIKRLLYLIERQIDRLQNSHQLTSDDTLRFCLSLLWNLTDENPIVCEIFIHSMGLPLFQRLLNLFASDSIVLTKILGLFTNIAEVSQLKNHLYSIEIISLMQRYLSGSVVDIAFSAAAILCHLFTEQTDDQINWDLCEQMRDVILSWQNPHNNLVTYRSFKPFFPLLFCTRIPVVQLWSLWAIYHVCSTDRIRYLTIIQEEKLDEVIQTLYDNQLCLDHPDQAQTQLLTSLIDLFKSF